MNPEVALLIVKILDIAVGGLKLAVEARRQYQAYSEKIKLMISEGRGPTTDELNELLALSDALTARIEAA